ncbi:glycoside hydrolase family 2 TIM barrel-domain containing protein [Sphingomonas sp. RS6]
MRHGTAALIATTAWFAIAAQPAVAQLTAKDARQLTPLTDGWRFHLGDLPEDAAGERYDDSAWAAVEVPHSWNRVGYYLPNPTAHLNRAETVNKTQGRGWYRLHFRAPASPGKRVWLEFDAASRVASVWLNGRKVGDHAGPFSRFRIDVSDAVRPGDDNLLVVRVDNSPPAEGGATADVLPLTGDFFVHGGLYRPVRLIVANTVHIDLADLGGSGVYATTKSATTDSAQVAVRTRIANDSGRLATVRMTARLIDAAGHVAGSAQRRMPLVAGTKGEALVQLDIPSPHLWQGVEDPYLYTLSVEVADDRGRVLDQLNQPFGIRTIAIDPDKGLFLNGRHLALHGVGYHQDREGKGWAIAPEDVAEDLAIMREMGANTIRLTHYQHGQTIHDLADRYGLLVWDEIPLVSAWTRRGELEPRAALVENARQQLRELIRQNGNHASVINWGIANEVDFGNSFPAFLTGYPDGKTPDPMPLLHDLQALAHAEDPDRPTALATCCEGRLFDPGVEIPTTAVAADLGGANRYFGWYFGVPGDLGPQLDALHAKRPLQPLSVTEYGAGAATTIHTDNVLGGPIDSRGMNQPEEYASYIHEEAWKSLKARPYLWATWLWNSFDFATTIRTEGDAQDINTKGLVTYDRKIRKDAYYFYKANWTTTPTVHLNGSRYTDRAYRVTDVRVYSNARSTDLIVNGQTVGRRTDCPDRVCVWEKVVLAPGANNVVARGVVPAGTVEDKVTWTLSDDAAASVRIDAGAIVAAPATRRFGSDDFFEGGSAGTLNKPADYGKPFVPTLIANSQDPGVAATFREGIFAYHIPLRPGRYRVRLTFVEPTLQMGARVFDVLANGRPIVQSLDIAGAAGGTAVELRREALVSVTGDMLDLRFVPTAGKAIVSAVEVLPE